jgi:acetate kinase
VNASSPPVVVVNAGSSSLKVKLLPQGWSFLVERIGGDVAGSSSLGALPVTGVRDHTDALRATLELLGAHLPLSEVRAVGHRVVHGGERYTAPVVVDEAVLAELEELSHLAPLHNPPNLAGIRAARALLDAPQVAVFDTAFHATLPPHAYLYGLPRALYEARGVRRYGFHGPSHDFVTRRAAELLGRPREALKLVSLHLGNGASAAAVLGGRSVDTTMGMTPLAGLVMGTRAGDVDPGALLYLLEGGMGVAELGELLNKRSGLLGLSGVSNDMRDVHRAAAEGVAAAAEAVAVFCYRVRLAVGAFAAAMGGLDGVVFTGGIGQHDAAVRARSLAGLEFLGIMLDAARNDAHETRISADGARVAVLVIPTDEERMIAEATLEALSGVV